MANNCIDEVGYRQERCPDCRCLQFSRFARKYLLLFKTCWTCDRRRAGNMELSIAELENREQQASI